MNNKIQLLTSGWARMIYALLEREGLDAAGLFATCNLNEEELSNPNGSFKQDDFTLLWNKASELTNDPSFGLRLGKNPMLGATFGAYSYAQMSSSNLLEAAERGVRYHKVIGSSASISARSIPEGYLATFQSKGNELPIAHGGFDAGLAITLETMRMLANEPSIEPVYAAFAYPEPEDTQAYEALFRCPLRFDNQDYQLCLSHETMALPSIFANQSIAIHNDQILAETLASEEELSLSQQVEHLIRQRLPNGEPSVKWVAAHFNIGQRTLQRRLKEENASYVELLEDTRKNLANEYLKNLNFSLQEITFLLGFNDHSNFYRAFKRWFGCTPGEYRSNYSELS
mgnify:CR=1 FL=1